MIYKFFYETVPKYRILLYFAVCVSAYRKESSVRVATVWDVSSEVELELYKGVIDDYLIVN